MSELTPLSLDDYDAIEAAVEETERGRWFLAEYARRNRTADTELVLDAISALERRFAPPAAPNPTAADLIGTAIAMAQALRRADRPAPETFAELEDTLSRALDAVGGGTAPQRPKTAGDDTAPGEPRRLALPAPAVAADDEAADDEAAWVDIERFAEDLEEDSEAAPLFAQEIVDVDDEPASDPAIAGDEIAGAASDETAEDQAPLETARFAPAEPDPAPDSVAQDTPRPQRSRLPAAHMPRLLDGLSEAEKAILFA